MLDSTPAALLNQCLSKPPGPEASLEEAAGWIAGWTPLALAVQRDGGDLSSLCEVASLLTRIPALQPDPREYDGLGSSPYRILGLLVRTNEPSLFLRWILSEALICMIQGIAPPEEYIMLFQQRPVSSPFIEV